MRLEDVTVTLRPRQPWEAIDLGCALVRRDFGRLLALWCVTVVPLWIGLCVLMRSAPAWIPLVVWWLKPLYDRVPLFFLSRSAFGVRPGFAQTWKAWPRLWLSGFLPALLWRRLSFIRSFALPAQMLEGLRGFAVKRRVKALALDGGGSGVLVSYAFLKIETVLYAAVLWGTYGFLPESHTSALSAAFSAFDFEGLPAGLFWWAAVCYMLVVTFVEPFYVGAGFGLYLNCRTRIEGWDVELAFRRLGARLAAPVAACLVALVCLLGSGTPAVAATGSEVQAKVKEVLESPDFEVHKIQSKRWVPEFDPAEKKEGKPWHLDFIEVLGEILFWGLITAVLSWLVWYLVKNRHLFVVRRKPKAEVMAPTVIMGMNITRASLPADIVAAARAAWAAGDFKEALSLLYRGSLSWLVTRRRVPITDSDTEEECLTQVITAGPLAEAEYFRQLTGAWMQAAYALMPVSNAEMNALCDSWPFVEKKGGRV